MSKSLQIKCQYRGKVATVVLTWDDTPFMCTAKYDGAGEVLGVFALMLETFSGYHIQPPSVFNVETYLNTAHAASARFEGFSYTVDPAFNLSEYLDPADKDPERVY